MLTQEEFSNRLKVALSKKNMKQTDLASAVGVSTANISNYMRGKAFPPIDTLVEIAKELDTSLDWLCGMDWIEGRIEEPKTYGDLAKVILSIIRNKDIPSVISTSHIKTARYNSDYSSWCNRPYDEEDVPSIAFTSGPIRTFIEDMITMMEMLAKGSISDDFYNRFIDDRIKGLGDQPIALEDIVNKDGEVLGDLPF